MQKKWLVALPIIAVLLLLCAVMGVIGAVTLSRIGRADGFEQLGFSLYNTSAEAEDEQSFEVSAATKLMVENHCGSVAVQAGESGTVQVTMQMRAWGRDQADAEKALKTIEMDAVRAGDTLRVGLKNAETLCSVGTRRPPEGPPPRPSEMR